MDSSLYLHHIIIMSSSDPRVSFADNNYDDSFRTCDDEDNIRSTEEEKSTEESEPEQDPFEDQLSGCVSQYQPQGKYSANYSGRRLTDETAPTSNTSLTGGRGKSGVSFAQSVVTFTPEDDDELANLYSDEKYPDDRKRLAASVMDYDDDFDDEATLEDCDNDLPNDSFSMLYVAKWNNKNLLRSLKEYLIPVSVFGMQMAIMVLLMINLLQTSDRQLITAMNVPVDVPITVKISQYIACMVSVFTADDLVTGATHVGKRVIKKGSLGVGVTGQRRKSFLRQLSEAQHLHHHQYKWELAK